MFIIMIYTRILRALAAEHHERDPSPRRAQTEPVGRASSARTAAELTG